MCGLVVVVIAVGAALLAGFVAPFAFDQTDFDAALQPPSASHWFGTDELGRDQFSRILYGLRVSVMVGRPVRRPLDGGRRAAGPGGRASTACLDPLVSRLTDTLLSFPFLVLAVGLAAILGPSLTTAIVAIGVGTGSRRSSG